MFQNTPTTVFCGAFIHSRLHDIPRRDYGLKNATSSSPLCGPPELSYTLSLESSAGYTFSMHTIPSLLPSLYDWGFWVPFFFRLFLAFQLYREARRLMVSKEPELIRPNETAPTPSARKTLSWMMMVLSFLFFLGLGIQLIAVFTAIAYTVRAIQISKNPDKAGKGSLVELLALSALVSFSLLFLGPGPYAIDLPL
jgi:hypothetical protein